MIRLLIFLVVIWLLYRAWTGVRHIANKKKPPRKTEKMVRCKTCDLYLPQDQAVRDEGGWYCCEAHREKNPG